MTQSEKGKKSYPKLRKFLNDKSIELREKYSKNPKRCFNCDIALSFENKRNDFCSKKCYYEFRKEHTRIKNNFSKICLFCGKNLKKGASKYCSHRCQYKQGWIEKKEFFEKNGYWKGCSCECSSRINNKRYLLEKYGHKCSICKNTKWLDQKIPLIMDHINGDSLDNRLVNIRLVCGNCNAQTSTYKGKNVGNGRFSRGIK